MGIYIRGMNMPKGREQYHRVTIYGNGQVIIDHGTYYEEAEAIPAPDVRPVKEGENITENNPVDEFVCSKCGIIIEDWSMVEIDEDDGERTNHEYVFRFCPNCGADMRGGADG